MNSFPSSAQAFTKFNIPSSNLSKTSKNTHFPTHCSFSTHLPPVVAFGILQQSYFSHRDSDFNHLVRSVLYLTLTVSMMRTQGHENYPEMFSATWWALKVYSRDICGFCNLAFIHPSTDNYILLPILRS